MVFYPIHTRLHEIDFPLEEFYYGKLRPMETEKKTTKTKSLLIARKYWITILFFDLKIEMDFSFRRICVHYELEFNLTRKTYEREF